MLLDYFLKSIYPVFILTILIQIFPYLYSIEIIAYLASLTSVFSPWLLLSDLCLTTYCIISNGFSWIIPLPLTRYSMPSTDHSIFTLCTHSLVHSALVWVLYSVWNRHDLHLVTQCFLSISFPRGSSTSSLPIKILRLRTSLTNFTHISFLKIFLTSQPKLSFSFAKHL